jgi:hypothetical protein
MTLTPSAPPSPLATAPDSEAAWLPASPSEGILGRLRGFSAADDEWWHEERRNACRAYLGTLLNWSAGAANPSVAVGPHDLPSDLHKLMLADLRANFPWADVLDLYGALASATAAARFGAVPVREEWADCLALGSEWKHIDAVADAVHFCRKRDERAKIIKHMLGVAHSPEEVGHDCARLREVV